MRTNDPSSQESQTDKYGRSKLNHGDKLETLLKDNGQFEL